MTNAEKFIKDFGFDGSIVCKCYPEDRPVGSCGYVECKESCGSRNYPRCPYWWNDEVKEGERE